MKASDYIIDLGPGAGKAGGNVIYAGVPKKLLNVKNSLTGQYLSGKKEIKTPKLRRNAQSGLLTLKGATGNNLKKINVDFPLGRFIVVTGGSVVVKAR